MSDEMLTLDPRDFEAARVDPELAALNAYIIAELKKAPDRWSVPVETVRRIRKEGGGIFPAAPLDPDAEVVTHEDEQGREIGVRLFRPRSGPARGTFLHIHGGGWVFGSAQENDPILRRLADRTGLAVASIDYRLAPEDPFPAAVDDCVSVARALFEGRLADLPTGWLAIGGESAGAHLAVLTLIRLRDDHAAQPFKAANLTAGCYDLSLTPSVRQNGDRQLILNTRDIEEFAVRFVPSDVSRQDPSVSPLYADLAGLPPALFSCGTSDLLIDDTLFMASRWLAAGNATTLSLTNGGCHVFQSFPTAASRASLDRMEAFLCKRIGG